MSTTTHHNINKRTINAAIRHLGLEIANTRGDGYSYFLDLKTGEQVGASVMVCYMNQLSLERWVEQAEWARKYPND